MDIELDHEFWVTLAKSWGLFYLMGLSVCVLIYACRPSKRKAFDHAARSVLDATHPDRPCQ